jgi:hypothetical protein
VRCLHRAAFSLLPFLFSLLASCAQIRQVSPADRFSDEEKLSYLVLAAIAPDAARQYASAGSTQARADYLAWVWKSYPVLPGAPSPSLIPAHSALLPSPSAFYRRRAVEARGYFGATDLLNDDRVLTYVRYGPARREQYEPRVVETESTRIFVNPAEIWSYDSIGRQFDFVRTGTAFKIVGQSRYGPHALLPALEPLGLSRLAPAFRIDAQPLGLDISLGRLGQHGDSVEVELAFGIPLRIFLPPADTGGFAHVTVDVTPHGKGTPVHSSSWRRCTGPLDTAVVDLAVGRETFDLPADVYTFTVTAVAADGQSAARQSRDLNLVDYAHRNQPVSDVLFYALVDSTSQTGQFARPDWERVIPLIAPRVRSGQSFYVLYEIYHLGSDSAGNHSAEVTYELMQRETREKAVLPAPRRFVNGPGATGVAVERVHTMDLKPGPYLLISRVRDLTDPSHPVDHASATAEFEILPRR